MNKVYIISEKKDLRKEEYLYGLDLTRTRRMDTILIQALGTALECIKDSGITQPDAIINATEYGCYEQDQIILRSTKNGSKLNMASHFMLSTPNTVATTIGIYLRNHGYNCTYSQGKVSYGLALQDAFIKIKMGFVQNALVCLNDYVEGPPKNSKSSAIMLSSKPRKGCKEILDVNIVHHDKKDQYELSTSNYIE